MLRKSLLLLFVCSLWAAHKPPAADKRYWIKGQKHFFHGYKARDNAKTINVVVEITAGTYAKWEVDTDSGHLMHTFKKGRPRRVRYGVPYPVNYGMVPQTIGGDGDPLDILLLGRARNRGEVIAAKLIGVMLMIDKGEVDDKLIAIPLDDKFRFKGIDSVRELKRRHKKIHKLLKHWFKNYKLNKKIKIRGFAGPGTALKILRDAMAAYKAKY